MPDVPDLDALESDLETPEPDLATLGLRRVPTQARSREKVERALASAEKLVATDGVEALTLPRVAEAAGLSVGALYQYLPDRDAIALALLARYHARLEQRLQVLLADDADPDPLRSALEAVTDVYRTARPAGGLRGAVPTAAGDAARRAHKDRMSDIVLELLRRQGLLPDGDPGVDPGVDPNRARLVARVVFTAADAVVHHAFDSAAPDPAPELAELERMLRAYLGLPVRTTDVP